MDRLYEPGKIGTLQLKNRWIMLAMHTGYAAPDGTFSERDFAFYRRRADGGMAAITLVGAVNEIGAQYGMHLLHEERDEASLKKVCEIIHAEDCKVIMQLFHAGRNNTAECHNGALPVCPSPVPSPLYRVTPKEMTEQEIVQTIADFAAAACRCKQCGVDAVEVSLSAGYLLTQFLSPRVNQRADRWGGSVENRMRFPREVLLAIREAVGPAYPVIIKISSGDMLGGYDLDLMIDLINGLPSGTIDGVTVTGGWHEAPVPQVTYHVKPGGFAHFAGEVKRRTGLPVIACNRINSPAVAERILEENEADFAGAARAFLADPDFAEKARKHEPYIQCQACNKGCIERVLKNKDIQCAFNPEAGREYEKKSMHGGNYWVVGGGPVGMTAALLLSDAGCHVTLFEQQERLGGNLNVACLPPFKQDLHRFIETLAAKLSAKQVKICKNFDVETLTPEMIKDAALAGVIFAVGAKPKRIEIAGFDPMRIHTAEEILTEAVKPEEGSHVVILGGGSVGLETAEFLGTNHAGYQVTVVEALPKAGKDLGGMKWIMMQQLKTLGVTVMTATTVLRGEAGKLLLQQDEQEFALPADHVVLAVGYRPAEKQQWVQLVEQCGVPWYEAGDGKKPGDVLHGLEDVFKLINQTLA